MTAPGQTTSSSTSHQDRIDLPPLNDAETEYSMQLFGDIARGVMNHSHQTVHDTLKKTINIQLTKAKDELGISLSKQKAAAVTNALFKQWWSIIVEEHDTIERSLMSATAVPRGTLLSADLVHARPPHTDDHTPSTVDVDVTAELRRVQQARERLAQQIQSISNHVKSANSLGEDKLINKLTLELANTHGYNSKHSVIEELQKVEKILSTLSRDQATQSQKH